MSAIRRVVEVAVFAPLRQTYTYYADATVSGGEALAGRRVRVPFGRGERIGVVLQCGDVPANPKPVLKRVHEFIDEQPLLDPLQLKLCEWASDYYHHPIGDVVATSLASQLRKGLEASIKAETEWSLSGEGAITTVQNAPRQALVMNTLVTGPKTAADFASFDFDWRRAMRELVKKGMVNERSIEPASPSLVTSNAEDRVVLNAAQQAATEKLTNAMGRFEVHLLHGVTGSGKTEVYIALISSALRAGHTALMLVPEIILTQQIVVRLRERFGGAVAVQHSAMTDAERRQVWVKCRRGIVRVLMGTRSAVWAPMQDLGVIVVDEEHDASFKQQEGFRYHARDVAIVRAQQHGIPIVLGTATPSMESSLNVRKKKYFYSALPQRAGSARMPTVQCLDVRGLPLQGGLSGPLIEAISSRLEREEQVLLFLNRRGFAPIVLCHACGWIAACKRCDAKLVWHKQSQRYICHHCGAQRNAAYLETCCEEQELIPLGIGTEQVAEALGAMFPERRIARIDRDTMRSKTVMEATFAAVSAGEIDVMIGTQMLAKGHDFSKVTLVGIVDADNQLFSTDFRAEERLAQMIVQVSGRAGRAEMPGTVLIQTHQPHHPLLQTLISDGYDRFIDAALEERRQAALPPYVPCALVRAEAPDRTQPARFLSALVAGLSSADRHGIEVLGPVSAAMEKKQGRYRAQLMVSAPTRRRLSSAVKVLIASGESLKTRRNVRWSVDVDPYDTL